MTNRDLELLASMTSLERINLHDCKRDHDKGIRALAALPALRKVQIEGSRAVTHGALAAFAPSVRIKVFDRISGVPE